MSHPNFISSPINAKTTGDVKSINKKTRDDPRVDVSMDREPEDEAEMTTSPLFRPTIRVPPAVASYKVAPKLKDDDILPPEPPKHNAKVATAGLNFVLRLLINAQHIPSLIDPALASQCHPQRVFVKFSFVRFLETLIYNLFYPLTVPLILLVRGPRAVRNMGFARTPFTRSGIVAW